MHSISLFPDSIIDFKCTKAGQIYHSLQTNHRGFAMIRLRVIITQGISSPIFAHPGVRTRSDSETQLTMADESAKSSKNDANWHQGLFQCCESGVMKCLQVYICGSCTLGRVQKLISMFASLCPLCYLPA